MSEPDVTGIPHKELRPIIQRVLDRVKTHQVVQDMLEEYGLDEEEIDTVPICFAKIDVSARTDHGVIYLNIALLEDNDLELDDHYIVHELRHVAQQTTGDKPTKGADDGVYLDNEYEVEGFQSQTEYLADTRGKEEAESYVEQVLDHHDVNNEKERERRKKELLQFAAMVK